MGVPPLLLAVLPRVLGPAADKPQRSCFGAGGGGVLCVGGLTGSGSVAQRRVARGPAPLAVGLASVTVLYQAHVVESADTATGACAWLTRVVPGHLPACVRRCR